MTNQDILYAKRLVKEMRSVAQAASKALAFGPNIQGAQLELFKGLGLALALFFEEMTQKEARNLKPKDIMEWADSLPVPEGRGRLEKIQ